MICHVGNSFFDFLDDNPPLISPTSKGEAESPQSKENIIPNERIASFLFPIFIELMYQFRSLLTQIGNLTQINIFPTIMWPKQSNSETFYRKCPQSEPAVAYL